MHAGKKVFITGASSGLGLELCRLFQEKGAQLIVTGRKDLPPAYRAIKADLKFDVEKLVQVIEEEVPDIVINCAGYGEYGPATEHSLDLLRVNAEAPIALTIAVAKALLKAKKEGVILNVSSAAGLIPMPYLALYSAAKAALTSFSRSFDAEMQDFGIRILVSLPGQIHTDFAKVASKGKYRQVGGMKLEWVAQQMMKQIEKKKPFQVLDRKVRFSIFLAKLLPKFARKVVMKDLRQRF